VLYQVRPGMPVSSAMLVVKTGGDANPPARPGLANFTAAMLTQGTTGRDALKIADDVAQIGAALNTASTKDATSASVTSLARNFGAALDILADITLHPSFPAPEIERQRASRLSSLIAASQDPGTVGAMTTVKALYGAQHPYGYIELGTPEAAKATTRDDLAGFWKGAFAPTNAALIIAGSMREPELRPLVEKAFGGWSGTASARPPLAAPATTDARVVIADAPGAPQTYVFVATIGPPRATPDYPALEVMNAALGGLFSSRINLNLREAHGYTYGANSQFVYRRGPGPFWIQSGVRTDVTAPAVREMLAEVARMSAAPMSTEELQMARDSIVRALPSHFETSASAVNTLADLTVYDLGLDYYSKFPGQVNAVTADAARAVAQKYLDPAKMIVVAVGDRAKIEPGLRQLNLGKVELAPKLQ
jgi:zinc protease